jgi:glyoxylase-like metal-dependent hydrolase (beta-lactamase superfamily II)
MNKTNPNQKPRSISRRHFMAAAGLAAAAVSFRPRRLFADDVMEPVEVGESPVSIIRKAAATATINVTKLRNNISVLEGSGGNIAVLTGPDGKLLIEAGITASRPRISAALASLGPEPITNLINTHWHFDHTDGNEWLRSEGAEITAHENTLKHLSVDTRVEGWAWTFPASPPAALPTKTFRNTHTVHLNGNTIFLEHYLPAHTDSDISVEFLDADIIHTGDTWWNGVYPFTDYSTGGSIEGVIRALETNISKVTDKTIIIPGHGPVGNKAQLIECRDMMLTVRDRVAALKRQGYSYKQVLAAAPTDAYDAKWGKWVIDTQTFIAQVYNGV